MSAPSLHKRGSAFAGRLFLTLCCVLASLFLITSEAAAIITVTPSTWDTIGLDSNSPASASGPYVFPVGAKITGGPANSAGSATLNWVSGGTTTTDQYIKIHGNSTLTFTYDSSGNAEVYFEVEIAQKDSTAFGQTRRYDISSGGVHSVTRELYIERLVSQARNGVTDVKVGTTELNMVSVPNGGSMSLIKDNIYYIQLVGFTATAGYEQLEAFINFDNTVIQILSVKESGSAASPITSPSPYLYADACTWDADPNSLNYRSCLSTGKFGGNITVTYQIKVLSVGGGSQTLNSLIHDYSGSSFHYNADYSTSIRTAYLINPATATIAKSFLPSTIAPGGSSTMTITLGNPNAGAIPNSSITDVFPAGMTVSSPLTFSTTCTGSPVITNQSGGALAVGSSGIRLTGATIPPGSCTLKVNVTTVSTPDPNTYVNTTQNLLVNGGTDTLKTATANLVVNSNFFPLPTPPSSCPGSEVTLATWTFSGTYSAAYAADSKPPSNVSSAIASSSGTTGSFSGGRFYGTDGWTTFSTVADASAPFVQFSLDTSNYGGVRIQYGHLISPTADWGGTNKIYTFSSADGVSYTNISNPNPTDATKGNTGGTLGNVGPLPAAATGTSTTSFRVIPTGSRSGQTTDKIELDNVTVTGCARPAITPPPPNLSKAFSPATIGAGLVSTLTFTITNTTAANVALTGVKFVDNLPAGVVVAPSPSFGTTCAGSPSWLPKAGDSTLNFGQTAGATMAINNTCTVSVNVTAAATGVYDNASEPVFAAQSGANTGASGIATATLTVVAPPAISKLFAPNNILANGVSTLSFVLTNPNAASALAGVNFTDSFPNTGAGAPGNMVVAGSSPGMGTVDTNNSSSSVTGSNTHFTTLLSNGAIIIINGNARTVASITDDTHLTLTTNAAATGSGLAITGTASGCGSPTYTPSPAAGSITFSGGTIAASGTCVVTVNVTAPTQGTYNNTSGAVAATGTSGGTTASATLTVTAAHPAIAIFKEVATSASAPPPESSLWRTDVVAKKDDNIYYQLTVQNDGDVQLKDVQATDPAFTNLATCNGAGWRYGDGVTPVPLDGSNKMTLEVASNSDLVYKDFATCIIGVSPVIPAVNGTVTNTATVNATYNSTPLPFVAALMQDTAKYYGFIPPALSKSFGAGSIGAGQSTTLTLILGNPATNPGTLAGLKVDDTFPAGMTLKDTTFIFTPAACGTVTKTDGITASAAGDASIRFSSASIAANTTCQVQVNVTSSTAGPVTNTTGTPTATGVIISGKSASMALTGSTASAPLTVTPLPSLTAIKYVVPVSDPVNNTTSPKAIPGAIMQYTVQVMNSGLGVVDNNTTVITDAIPAHTVMCVSNSCSNPPVALTSCSATPPCGLTLTYGTDVTFSNQVGGGAPYSYTPSPDGSGFDNSVTGVRINPQGILNAASGGNNASFSLTFKVKIK